MNQRPPLPQRFADTMGQLLGPDFPSAIGLAVSGGGDSMAMLHLAHPWARDFGIGLRVVTVDHGLRPESADEARAVAAECATLGWPHDTLEWQGRGASGNVSDAARRARLDLIGGWAGDLRHVLFAHTADDQAETLLMRLSRGSGVDGLAAMRMRRRVGGFEVLRPLLDERREALRAYLRLLKVEWAEDPTNDDPDYGRVRMRRLLHGLEAEGGDVPGLAATAARMGRAQAALRARAADVARRAVVQERVEGRDTGDLLIDRDAFAGVERETQLRILAGGLCWIASAEYRPRAAPLEALLERCLAGGKGTLHGCIAAAQGRFIRLGREYAAVRGLAASGDIWDGRWHIVAPEGSACALGEDGLAQMPGSLPVPRRTAMALPAILNDGRLMACPPLGFGPPDISATLCAGDFAEWLAAH